MELAAREADVANWGVLEALELEATAMAMRCAEYHTVLEAGGDRLPLHTPSSRSS